jgi:HTH-type transcriptional regulator, sugar sensing transcriptional regulator
MGSVECARLFQEMGLTQLEAEIYVYLVQDSPATGYKISKGIGRSKTNTYKALASLQTKGAIYVDDGDARRCRAVPPDELLDQIARRFAGRRALAAEAVKQLAGAPSDNRVYALATVDQVYCRCRQMLRECREVGFVDTFPEPLAVLREEIEAAARRGVKLAVQVYEPADLSGVEVIINRSSADILRRWAVQWVSLFLDGEQHLIALLARGGEAVHQARWSASPILSWAYFSYADSDFLLSALAPLLETSCSVEELRSVYRRWKERFPEGAEPGYRYMVERFGWKQ